jgi:hypothetical protein
MSRPAVAFAIISLAVVEAGCGEGDDGGARPGDGGSDAAPACSLGRTMAEIEEKLFRSPKCLACHGRVTLFPTTLDLVSEGLAARVVDKAAETNPDKGKCAGKMLLPRGNPKSGVFVEKVAAAKPSCGDVMPQGLPRLSADEIACVELWAVLAAAATP